MNFAAPPPAKKHATASGFSEAISVSSAWNSTLGKGRPNSLMMVPPASIALPFKLMLFVLADGWQLLIGALAQSFYL